MNDNEQTYSSLGFQVLLILNRLRNARDVEEYARENEETGNGADSDREADRAKLALVKKRGDIRAPQVWGDPERTARTK